MLIFQVVIHNLNNLFQVCNWFVVIWVKLNLF